MKVATLLQYIHDRIEQQLQYQCEIGQVVPLKTSPLLIVDIEDVALERATANHFRITYLINIFIYVRGAQHLQVLQDSYSIAKEVFDLFHDDPTLGGNVCTSEIFAVTPEYMMRQRRLETVVRVRMRAVELA